MGKHVQSKLAKDTVSQFCNNYVQSFDESSQSSQSILNSIFGWNAPPAAQESLRCKTHYESTTMLIIHSYLCASLRLTFSPSSRSLSRDVLSVFCSSSGPPDSNSCSWSWSWLSSSAPSAVDRDLFSGAFTRPEEHSANTVLHTGNTSLLKIETNQPTEKDRTPESIQKMKH